MQSEEESAVKVALKIQVEDKTEEGNKTNLV